MKQNLDLCDSDTLTGTVFTHIVEITALAIFAYGLIFHEGGTWLGLYDRVWFGGFDMHRFTLLVMFASFYLHWRVTDYLYPLARFVVNCLFATWYIYAQQLRWTLNSIIFRGTGWRFLALYAGGLAFISLIMYRVNSTKGFLKIRLDDNDILRVIWVSTLQLVAFIMLAATGFWEALTLSDVGLGPDPNASIWWLLWKLSSFWVLYPLLFKGSVPAPRRMDPRVF